VPLASASAIVGVDYSASLQASSIPLLLLPFPEDASAYASSAAQAANTAATDHSCVFSSPTTVDKAAGSGAAARNVSTHAKGLDSAAASCSPASEQWHQSRLNTLLDPAAISTDENAQHEDSMEPHESEAAVDQSTEQQVARYQQNEPAQDGEGLTRSEGQKMRCVLLIPCCEAVHGRFPLNGTYFQTNEVFLDFSTLQQPIMVSPYKELASQNLFSTLHSVYIVIQILHLLICACMVVNARRHLLVGSMCQFNPDASSRTGTSQISHGRPSRLCFFVLRFQLQRVSRGSSTLCILGARWPASAAG